LRRVEENIPGIKKKTERKQLNKNSFPGSNTILKGMY
jgi:hypothetical protein